MARVSASCDNVLFSIKMPCNTGSTLYGKQVAIGWHCLQDRKQCALVIGQRKYFAWLDGWRFVWACHAIGCLSRSRAVFDVIVIIRIIMFHNAWPLSKYRPTKEENGRRISVQNERCYWLLLSLSTHTFKLLHFLLYNYTNIRWGGFLCAVISIKHI